MRLFFVMVLIIIANMHLCDAADLSTDKSSPTANEQKTSAESNTTPTPLPNIYKWVDDKGLTHYGDEPPSKDMAPISLPDIQILKNADLEKIIASTPNTTPDQPTNSSNYRLTILSPKNNETVMRNKEGNVIITLSLNVPLLESHHISMSVDGNEMATDDTGTINLPLNIGDHVVQVFIMDNSKNVLADSDTITFTVIENDPTVIVVQPVITPILRREPALPTTLPTTLSTNTPAPITATPSPLPTVKPTKTPRPTKEPKVTPKPGPYISG